MATLETFLRMQPADQRRFVASLSRDQQAALARDAFAVARAALKGRGVGFSFGGLLSGLQSIASVAAPVLSVAVPGAGGILAAVSTAANVIQAGAQAFSAVRNAINPPRAAAAAPAAPAPTPQQQAPAKDNTALYLGLGVLALFALGGRR